MNTNQIHRWMDAFGLAWSSKDVDVVMGLFDKDNIEYFESVFNPPLTDWAAVKKLWAVVPANQKDITFSYDIVLSSKASCVIHWNVSRVLLPANEKQLVDGIFLIRLNNKGLCTFFKQWRAVKAG